MRGSSGMGCLDIVLSVIKANDRASELLSEKESAGASSGCNVKNVAVLAELQELAESFGQFQAAGMKRIAQKQFGKVALVKIGATLLDCAGARSIGRFHFSTCTRWVDVKLKVTGLGT